VRGRNNQHQLVTVKTAELQVLAVGFAADQSQVDLPVLYLMKHLPGVADRRPNLDVRVPLPEPGQQVGEEVFAGYGAGGKGQLACKGGLAACDFSAGLGVQGLDALGEGIKAVASLRQEHAPPLTAEQRGAKGLLQGLDALADGRLG
jgi:hypothetical protein